MDGILSEKILMGDESANAPECPEPPRFLADCHLGKLARHLRFAGYDTLSCPIENDRDLAELARKENRILLSRDREFLQRRSLPLLLLHSQDLEGELLEMIHAFPLASTFAPFTRCMECNEVLETVRKERIAGSIPPGALQTHDSFKVCPRCHRVYWKGDHYQSMIRRWKRLFEEAATLDH